jgi:iron complex outermembrane recepter protein
VGPNAFAQQINYGGSKFTETADFQGNIVLGYEVLSGGMRYAIEGDARYSSSVNFDFEPGRVITGVAANAPTSLAPNFSADDFVVANARISVGPEDERWKAQLWVRNLTDQFYVTSVRKALDASVQYTGKPRTYGVTLEFKFF